MTTRQRDIEECMLHGTAPSASVKHHVPSRGLPTIHFKRLLTFICIRCQPRVTESGKNVTPDTAEATAEFLTNDRSPNLEETRAVIPTTANIFISGLIRAPAIASSMPVGTDSILGVISLFTVFATDWTLLLVSVTKKTADSLAAVINGRSGVPFGGMVSVSSASFNRPLAPSGIFVFFLFLSSSLATWQFWTNLN